MFNARVAELADALDLGFDLTTFANGASDLAFP